MRADGEGVQLMLTLKRVACGEVAGSRMAP